MKEDVEPSALPTIFSAEKEFPEFAEFRALIILSLLSLLSIHPTTILFPCEEIAISLTELVELRVLGDPNELPLSEDLANTVL